jgi:hypothetical protein
MSSVKREIGEKIDYFCGILPVATDLRVALFELCLPCATSAKRGNYNGKFSKHLGINDLEAWVEGIMDGCGSYEISRLTEAVVK